MAEVFDDQVRIVPTWLAAARHLDGRAGREDLNLILEIKDPLTVTAADRVVIARVDDALQSIENSGLTVRTVAGTIFPQALYLEHGHPAFYDHYLRAIKRGKKANTWGTYAHRMISRPSKDGKGTINPLDMIVTKLREDGQPKKKKTGAVSSFTSAYELGIAEPEDDLANAVESKPDGAELPTYSVSIDGKEWLGFPCLSHVSFKRVADGTGHKVNMTAIYRSHHYCARALGNLIGLGQLLSFVAKESKLGVGVMTCVSTHATLDVPSWGGVKLAREVLG